LIDFHQKYELTRRIYFAFSSPPSARITPERQTVDQGSSIEIRCTPTGNPTPTIEWSKVGSSLPPTVQVLKQDTNCFIYKIIKSWGKVRNASFYRETMSYFESTSLQSVTEEYMFVKSKIQLERVWLLQLLKLKDARLHLLKCTQVVDKPWSAMEGNFPN